jgi:hypothetical protein
MKMAHLHVILILILMFFFLKADSNLAFRSALRLWEGEKIIYFETNFVWTPMVQVHRVRRSPSISRVFEVTTLVVNMVKKNRSRFSIAVLLTILICSH